METDPKTVVVAEDEILIRIVAVEVLADAGFEVIEAGNAEEALAILQSRPRAIHLLFTDIHMPGQMSGLELAHHVRRVWPQVAVIIASGRDKPHPSALPNGTIFLTKPYNPDHLLLHAKTLTAA